MCIESRVPDFVLIRSATTGAQVLLAADAEVQDRLLNVPSWFFRSGSHQHR